MINRIRFGNGVEVSGANKLLQKQDRKSVV